MAPKGKSKTKKPRSKKTATASNKKIAKVVKRVLHSQLENKRQYNLDTLFITPQMDTANLFEVIPAISQGTRQAERIGNRIKPIKLNLKMSLSMVNGLYAPSDTGRTGVYFDVYLFTSLTKPTYNTPLDSTDLDYFLQAGNAFNRYKGAPWNYMQDVNLDRFKLLKRKRILMNNNFHKADANNYLPYEGFGQNSNSAITLKFNLKKYVKSQLKYQDSINFPTNNGIYAIVVATRADNVAYTDPAELQFPIGTVGFFSELIYEDS